MRVFLSCPIPPYIRVEPKIAGLSPFFFIRNGSICVKDGGWFCHHHHHSSMKCFLDLPSYLFIHSFIHSLFLFSLIICDNKMGVDPIRSFDFLWLRLLCSFTIIILINKTDVVLVSEDYVDDWID